MAARCRTRPSTASQKGVGRPSLRPSSDAQYRVDLERPVRLHVLQHRRLERAQFARHGDARSRAHPRRQPKAGANSLSLVHHSQHERMRKWIVEEAVGCRTRQRTERVHVHVAPKLGPDIRADVVGGFDIEAACGQRRHERPRSRCASRIRRTDNEPVAAATTDHAGSVGGRGQMDDAAESTLGRQCARHGSAGVDGLDALARERRVRTVEKPPRQAVHGADDGRALDDEGAKAGDNRRQRVRLQRNHDEILGA